MPLTSSSAIPILTSSLSAQEASLLPLPVALGGILALVVQLLALRQGKPQLGAPLGVEIELQGHHRHALPVHGDSQFVDLPFVQQQPAWTARVVLEEGAG